MADEKYDIYFPEFDEVIEDVIISDKYGKIS